ncbi:HlyD family type I secretion periplasmic adaptor subunit [Fulvimarina sp. MAC8]|uniref:HlyD family type I secretion periplasmic adaptor subunit n=1 Tax=Fulvimarina sp. MAC8 TaxID=3162874 RepID=UPI0032EC63A1
MKTPQRASTSWGRPAFFGYAVIAVAFFGLGGWSASAPLDSAVVASGLVTVESNRKTVQHYEGGIVREILVKEGQRVEQGEVLFRLDATQARANLSTITNQYYSALARQARLEAERQGLPDIVFPDEVLANAESTQLAREISDQKDQFRDRKAAIAGQIDILDSRIEQLNRTIEGVDLERQAALEQIGFIDEQLAGFDRLVRQNLIQKSQVVEVQRERSRLAGDIGRSAADIARSRSEIAEAELQKTQTMRQFIETVNEEIVEVRQSANDLREKIGVASDIFSRLEITAPRDGRVQNLQIFTQGAVVRPGDPLLDLVPEDEGLLVQARIAPFYADNVLPGMLAEVRLPSFQIKNLPSMFGSVASVSADRLVDEREGEPYFLALVKVDESSLPEKVAAEMRPGLPAEIIIPTGERTVLEYLTGPILDRLRASLREE